MPAQTNISGMLLLLCSFGWLLANCLVLAFGECKSNLLDKLPEAAFESSSAASQRYGPSAARISSKDPTMQYRAWCPSNTVSTEEREYLQVDLGRQHFVKLIITKGLSTEAKGGLHLTPNYYIWYRREERGKPWIKYQNFNGTTRIKGNLDAQTERYVTMNPPFVARWVRIYPFNHEPVPVCLKLEIIGCDAGGIIEYQAPMGTLLPPGGSKFGDQSLLDTSYDDPEIRTTMVRSALLGADGRANIAFSSAVSVSQPLTGGLGKLTDGEPDGEYSADPLPSSAFVGWKRNGEEHTPFNSISARQDYVRLMFLFDGLYNFTGLRILLANTLGSERALPRLIEARLSRQFPRPDSASTLATVIEPPVSSAKTGSQWVHLDIARPQSSKSEAAGGGATEEEKTQSTAVANLTSEYDAVARFVDLRIYYGGPWIVIGEVSFINAPFVQPPNLNLDAEAPPPEMKHLVEAESDDGSSNLPVRATPPLRTPPIQPHTYALVVGIGCLALLLIIMVLVMIAHWRRRSFTGRHKLEKLSLSLQQHTGAAGAAAKPLVKPEAQEQTKLSPPSSGVKVNAGTSTQGVSAMGGVDLPFQWDYSNPIMHDPSTMRDAVFMRPGYTTGYLSGLPMLHPLIQTNPNSSLILPSCISSSRHIEASDAQGEDMSADQYFQVAPDSGVYTTLPGSESESGNQVLDSLGMQPIYMQEGGTYVNTMGRTANEMRLLSPLTHNQQQARMYHIPPPPHPPPPCIPLPPPPTHPPPSPVSSSTTCYAKPDWSSRGLNRGNCVNTNQHEKEFTQRQSSQEVTAAGTMGPANTFSYRYSIPSNRNGVHLTPIFAGPGGPLGSLLDHGTTLWSQLHRRRDDIPQGQCYASSQQQQPPTSVAGMILSVDGGADLAAGFPMSEYSSPTPVSSIIYGGFQGSPSLLPHLVTSHSESPDTGNAS